MDAQDGQVPAPRRASLPRLRRPAEPTALPFAVPGEPAPRVADLSALLGDIDALRMTLQTDLTLAAAALEADATDLAGELVDGDLREVRAFGVRSAARLAALGDSDAAPDEHSDLLDVEPVETSPLPRRRVLSAAPLMAAAAALIGFVAFVPDRGGVPESPETTMTSAAIAGYELTRLAQAGAPDEALRLAAEELNDELAELIKRAQHDPAAAQQALMLLEATSEVLALQGDSGVLRSVMAETQLLRKQLREALPVAAQRPIRSTRPGVRKAVPTAASLPVIQQQPEKSREAEPSTAPKPSASPKPSPKPSPSTPAPQPSAEPSSSSTSEPTKDGDGPLPAPDDLPGW